MHKLDNRMGFSRRMFPSASRRSFFLTTVVAVLVGQLFVCSFLFQARAGNTPPTCDNPSLKWVLDSANIIVECDTKLGNRQTIWLRQWLAAPCAPGPNCNPPEPCSLNTEDYPGIAWALVVAKLEDILRDGFTVEAMTCARGLYGAPWCRASLNDSYGRLISSLLREQGMFCQFLP